MTSGPFLRMTRVILTPDVIKSIDLAGIHLDKFELNELARRNYRRQILVAQYVYSRLALKMLLSRNLLIPVGNISIRSDNDGSPNVLLEHIKSELISVSISHDNLHILVAFCLGSHCAVDIQGVNHVDWTLVMQAMGWSEQLKNPILDARTLKALKKWPSSFVCALVWCSYEVWMKLTRCRGMMGEFSWREIYFIEEDLSSCDTFFRLDLSNNSTYDIRQIYLRLCGTEIIGVGFLAS